MIAKTLEEKEQLKAAKADYNKSKKLQVKQFINNNKPTIRNGLLDTEKELASNYPVYWNYFYVVQFGNEYKVIMSDIQGTVAMLERDLTNLHKRKPDAIYSCDLKRRNLL